MTQWDPELAELEQRRGLATRMGGDERVARQHAAGRLTVRERIERLVDKESFAEVGGLTGSATCDDDGNLTELTSTNFVTGRARVDGRRVVIAADDFTVRGGAAY